MANNKANKTTTTTSVKVDEKEVKEVKDVKIDNEISENEIDLETATIKDEVPVETKVENTQKEDTETKIISRKNLKIGDDVILSVKSNVAGELIYINHKTGDEIHWAEYGDVQTLKAGDIRAMKAKQPRFLTENWIAVEGIEDADENYEDVDIFEILEALGILQYYKDNFYPKNINEVFNWREEEMRNKIPSMPKTIKDTLIINANELISSGILDSMRKIKTLEEILGCELMSLNDN